MSSEAIPISPTRFAEALKDLPISTLHLKAAELRNSIAHLDYSNEEMLPFANGTEPSQNGISDPDCAEAIRENEAVIARMIERIELLKKEVENRGASWSEFLSAEEVAKLDGLEPGVLVNGTGESHAGEGQQAGGVEERSSAWSDGTFQTGRIVNGDVVMDEPPRTNGAVNGVSSAATNRTSSQGGRLDDETLSRAMEARMRALAEDDDEGMHL